MQGSYLWSCSGTSFWSVPGRGTLLRGPRTTGVGGLLGQILSWVLLGHLLSVSARSWDLTPWSENHRSWGPARADLILGLDCAPPFGQCPVVGPYSLVREPQELGGLQGQILSWVLIVHLLSVSVRLWDLTLWSENHRSWGVCQVRSYLGSCSVTSFRSVPRRGTLLRGPRTAGVEGSVRADLILGPARAPPFGQCSVVGPYFVVREPHELGGLQGQILSPAWAPPFDLILGPDYAPPFDQCPVVGPYSVVREPHELGGLQGQILGPARAPPFGQCPVVGP
ncbi:hypothetical protein TIFTF001_020124 [Ficus carica]|uniref:Uncharacterized protein n=1 Tax=Ficus carica TaxID=3494 RepID=A0AA88D9J7_FICCA|nr:hypothetical protein TIFTF001_020124 [Ficus carica]